jgi:hypothetical protein
VCLTIYAGPTRCQVASIAAKQAASKIQGCSCAYLASLYAFSLTARYVVGRSLQWCTTRAFQESERTAVSTLATILLLHAYDNQTRHTLTAAGTSIATEHPVMVPSAHVQLAAAI